MKGCFTTLLLALVAAFIAAFFGRSCHRQGVEEILTERVASELKTQYPGVNVKYDHLTAIVSGTADESQLQEIRARVKELALGNGRVHFDVSGKESVPTPKLDLPYFTIIRDSGKIILDGMVDSGQTKSYLGQAALRDLGKFGLENQIKVGAKTAPYPDFGNVVEAIPVLLKQAEDAKVEANPGRVIVSGTVADENAKKNLLGLFASSKWNGAEIVDQIKIKPAPVVPQRTEPASFSVTRQNNSLKLIGTVDSEQTKNAIGNAAKIDGVTVDNQIKVSETTMAFPGLNPMLAGIPSLISSAKNGKIDVDPGKVTLSGQVDTRAAKQSVIGFYSGDQWAGTEIVDRIKVKPTQAPAFVIERNNDKLVLRGTVDSQRTKNMLANAAKLEGVTAENQIKISEEVMAFPELNATLTAIPGLLNSAKNGKIDVRQKKVVVSGQVDNRPGKNSVMGFFSGPQWQGLEVVDQIRIKPNLPPSFVVQRKSDKVTLTGRIDKPAAKARLGDAAKMEGITVDNQIKVNEEVLPFPEFESAVSSVPVFVGSTQNGKIEMSPTKVDISGGVTDEAAQGRLRDFFAGLNWKGPKFDGEIKIASMPTRAPSFVIARNAEKLTLTGDVDSPEA
ncbi:MAG: BON domain-containing protein, partial [Verrucomicrobiales bacterium]|nr:BON domain-containing protein [Verrucomicrobiales bacterium]